MRRSMASRLQAEKCPYKDTLMSKLVLLGVKEIRGEQYLTFSQKIGFGKPEGWRPLYIAIMSKYSRCTEANPSYGDPRLFRRI